MEQLKQLTAAGGGISREIAVFGDHKSLGDVDSGKKSRILVEPAKAGELSRHHLFDGVAAIGRWICWVQVINAGYQLRRAIWLPLRHSAAARHHQRHRQHRRDRRGELHFHDRAFLRSGFFCVGEVWGGWSGLDGNCILCAWSSVLWCIYISSCRVYVVNKKGSWIVKREREERVTWIIDLLEKFTGWRLCLYWYC